jgi:hypothetical protein
MKDGFMLLYIKDKKAHTVLMSKEQLDNLQKYIPIIFQHKPIEVNKDPMGEVENIAEKKENE